jgi:hypothetical protein
MNFMVLNFFAKESRSGCLLYAPHSVTDASKDINRTGLPASTRWPIPGDQMAFSVYEWQCGNHRKPARLYTTCKKHIAKATSCAGLQASGAYR